MNRLDTLLESVFDGHASAAREAASFQDVEGWDSLAYVRLVVAVQDEYDVELDADEIQQLLSYEGLRGILAARGVEA